MIERLKQMLEMAIHEAYHKDGDLFRRGGLEQACVFRIGYYLQLLINQDGRLNHLNLDCEYNKNGYDNKRTPRFPKGTRPDLILHERTSNEENTLIVEFKGWWCKQSQNDKQKLEDFTSPECGYRYKLGAFVVLCKEHAQISYFQNGTECV